MNKDRPNPVRLRYDRADLVNVLLFTGLTPGVVAAAVDAYELKRTQGADAPCQAVVHHGPGHQSSTYCQVRGGPEHHDTDDETGKPMHYADLPSGGYAEWVDDDPYARDY